MNPLHPNLMSTKERLAEVCEILATGIVRLRLREAQSAANPEQIGLHFSPAESGHANANDPSKEAA